jgi:hyperosmotically inducible protein
VHMKVLGLLIMLLFVPAISMAQAEHPEKKKGEAATTADKQSNKKADVETLQKIRRAITEDTSLSTKAHNVKINVKEGMVTLRGPVESMAEKERVEDAAKSVAGATNVQSHLEVAKSKEDKSKGEKPKGERQ